MELCYRGITYQATTKLVNTVASNITARFLGKTYTVRQASCPILIQSDWYKYRGISYYRGSQQPAGKAKHYREKGGFIPTAS